MLEGLVGMLLAVAGVFWYILWLQLTSFKSCTAFVTLLTCSLSLCSCALFSFDWVMNFRKCLTSHHLNSKHPLLNNLMTSEHCRQYETSWFFFCDFCVFLWKHVTAVMKNWQNLYKICRFQFAYFSQFGNHSFYSQEAWSHSGGIKTVNEGYLFLFKSQPDFFIVSYPRSPLKRKLPSNSLLVVDSFPEVLKNVFFIFLLILKTETI